MRIMPLVIASAVLLAVSGPATAGTVRLAFCQGDRVVSELNTSEPSEIMALFELVPDEVTFYLLPEKIAYAAVADPRAIRAFQEYGAASGSLEKVSRVIFLCSMDDACMFYELDPTTGGDLPGGRWEGVIGDKHHLMCCTIGCPPCPCQTNYGPDCQCDYWD